MHKSLNGKVAVVAGASRGAGRGIALALGSAGVTVYVTGRTTRAGARPLDGAPGSIEDTAEEVSARGGEGIAVRVDYTIESEVAAVFARVLEEQGRLDVLGNAVWGAADAVSSMDDLMKQWGVAFWEQPASTWQHMMLAGPYAYYLASHHAARIMVAQKSGLIAGVTDGIMDGVSDDVLRGAMVGEVHGQLVWHLAHEVINRLLAGMSGELKKHKVAVVTLMPGFMRTERVLMHMDGRDDLKKSFRFDLSETTEYLGRAVAALAADPKVIKKTGRIHFVADLAKEYGFTDTDDRYVPRFNPFASAAGK
jgi:NAD(P)-dependent dehydrogenase (short-subunit alcohol dehydrogenase family)